MESKSSNLGRSHNWIFTINNPGCLETSFDDDVQKPFWDLDDEGERPAGCNYIIAQLEQGDMGTYHLQGYAEFKNAIRLSTLKSWKSEGHFEPRRGTQKQAIEYCGKSDTRVAGPWTWGTPKRQGERSDLNFMVEEVKEGKEICNIIFEYPPALKFISHLSKLKTFIPPKRRAIPRIAWLYGITGSGKTHCAWECFESPYLLCETEGSGPQWWEGYSGEQCVIFDEFSGQYPFKQLLQVLDSYPFRVAIKGSSSSLCAEKFIITSNAEPENFYSGVLDRTPFQRRLHDWSLFGRFSMVGDEFQVECELPDGTGGRTKNGPLNVKEFITFLKTFMDQESV